MHPLVPFLKDLYLEIEISVRHVFKVVQSYLNIFAQKNISINLGCRWVRGRFSLFSV